MKLNGRNSSFQSVILKLISRKLNLMLTEVFQLDKKVSLKNHRRLTKIVLKNIASSKIKSVHITPHQACRFIEMLDEMDCHKELGKGLDYLKEKEYDQTDEEQNNPFYQSPFR